MTKPDFVPADKVEAKNIKDKVRVFFTGSNVDVIDYWKCKKCGGYNKPPSTKRLSYNDKVCRGCGASR